MKTVRIFTSLLAGFAVLATMGTSALAAGSAIMSVNPTSGSYTTGNTFTVTISENSGTNDVDSARAQLSYNASTLEIVGYSTAGNPFTTCASQPSYGGGSINTGDCTLLGGKKQGQQPLGAVTFKVLASSGSSSLTFSSSSQVVNNGVDSTLSFVNGSYNYSAPAPTGGMGGGSSSGSNSGSNSSNSGTNTSHSANTTSNSNKSAATSNTSNNTVATTTPSSTNSEVKSDTTKVSTPKKNDDTKKTATTKSGSSVWTWIVLVLIAVVAAMYVWRKRREPIAANDAVVTDAKQQPKAGAADKGTQAAKSGAAVQSAASQKGAQKTSTQSRKKPGKKTKHSR